MEVRILNPEVVRDLYKNHGQFACVCYNTPEKYAERVGKKCQENGHYSGSRCEYIKFHISGIDRGTAEQCLRHEIGTDVPFHMQDNYSFADYAELVKDIPADHIVKNMASFRYIDKSGFKWYTPDLITKCPEANTFYDILMSSLNDARKELERILLNHFPTKKKEINEVVNFVLPRATITEFEIGFTPEALIHFCHKRMCVRAQEGIYKLAHAMAHEVFMINEEFAKELKPQCEHLLWCPEGEACCGRKPTKAKLKELLENGEW